MFATLFAGFFFRVELGVRERESAGVLFVESFCFFVLTYQHGRAIFAFIRPRLVFTITVAEIFYLCGRKKNGLGIADAYTSSAPDDEAYFYALPVEIIELGVRYFRRSLFGKHAVALSAFLQRFPQACVGVRRGDE